MTLQYIDRGSWRSQSSVLPSPVHPRRTILASPSPLAEAKKRQQGNSKGKRAICSRVQGSISTTIQGLKAESHKDSMKKCLAPCVSQNLTYKGVSINRGTPKSSILIGFSIIFTIHFGIPLFLENTHKCHEVTLHTVAQHASKNLTPRLGQRVPVH